MENEDPEVIRRRMLENRTALTEKLEALEQQVLGVASSVTNTVESVTEGVQETVDAVKDTVQETVDSVKDTFDETVDTVKDTFNLSRQVERHPWLVLGGAVGVGLLLSALLRRRTVETVTRTAGNVARRLRGGRSAPRTPAAEGAPGNGASKPAEPGVADQVLGTFKEGLGRVKDMALSTLLGTLQRVLTRELPQAVESQVKTFVDDTVTKIKDAVTHPTAARTQEEGLRQEERQEPRFHPETGRPMGQASW
jgi:ElaB/YqjD/DUF883 family membrane-anchored ribosome-binding protein